MRSTLMMRAQLLALLLGLGALACGDNPVGRSCFIGTDAANPNLTVLASPALECQSRICLHLAEGFSTSSAEDLCTAECSDDNDCDKVAESPCPSGFICAVATTSGPFCCKKVCMCADYVASPDGGLPTPAACDPSNAVNECCNLEGRRGNPDYPQCK